MVACGSKHSLALSAESVLYSWGRGCEGQLGHGQSITILNKPMVVGSTMSRGISFVAAGGQSTIALAKLGFMVVFGSNVGGQLAAPRSRARKHTHIVWDPLFLRPPALFNFVSIGEAHAAALTPDGCLYTWGTNAFGCLGHGKGSPATSGIRQVVRFLDSDNTPLRTAPACGFVSCGKSHTAVLTTTGKLFTFGDAAQTKTALPDHAASPTRLDLVDGDSRV
jgi:alpha-tubulin suppressor-like RCC1 family protein